jgi:hypothetical protein
MVWLYRSPISVGMREVISSFKLFIPAFPRVERRGWESAPCDSGTLERLLFETWFRVPFGERHNSSNAFNPKSITTNHLQASFQSSSWYIYNTNPKQNNVCSAVCDRLYSLHQFMKPKKKRMNEWENLLLHFFTLGPTVLNYETILYATYF